MSKPEPIEGPSLDESLALVRRMLAESAPAARAPSATGAGVGADGATGAKASVADFELPSVLRAPAQAPDRGTPVRGRLTDALRSLGSYPPEEEKRAAVGAVDDDLADLMDTGPQPVVLPHPSGGALKDLAPMDLRGRARVAPSFDGNPRGPRARTEPGSEPSARVPVKQASERPTSPSLLGSQDPSPGAASDPFRLPMGRSPVARLPSLDANEPAEGGPGARVAGGEPGGWPRGALRAEPELPGLVSAPPSDPVVIAAMPPSGFAAPLPFPTGDAVGVPSPALPAGASGRQEDVEERAAVVLPMPPVEAQERQEDTRFELIAAIGPAVAAMKAAPPTVVPEAEGEASKPVALETSGPVVSEAAGAGLEVIAVAPPAVAASVADEPTSNADAEGEASAKAAGAEAPVASPPELVATTSAVDEVASVLDRLVAGLSASAASAGDLPKLDEVRSEPQLELPPKPAVTRPEPVTASKPEIPAPRASAAEPSDAGASAAALSVVSSAEAFIGGVHAQGEEPKAPATASTDAMLQLVGTSVALGHDGALETPGEVFDDTVAELLRPMLRKWLESNMPRIVEKALRKELADLQAEIRKAAAESK